MKKKQKNKLYIILKLFIIIEFLILIFIVNQLTLKFYEDNFKQTFYSQK
jgi:hypothetical protein